MWWNKWLSEETLRNNIITFNHILLSPSRTALQDFTTPLVELSWFLITVSLLMAVMLRRKFYPLFQYTHKFIGIVYYVSALIHSWSFWFG